MSSLEDAKLPVRHNGWVNAAFGVKYVSITSRCLDGGDCVSKWITVLTSFTVKEH